MVVTTPNNYYHNPAQGNFYNNQAIQDPYYYGSNNQASQQGGWVHNTHPSYHGVYTSCGINPSYNHPPYDNTQYHYSSSNPNHPSSYDNQFQSWNQQPLSYNQDTYHYGSSSGGGSGMTGGPYYAAPPQSNTGWMCPQIMARKRNAENEGDAGVDPYEGEKRGSKTEDEVEKELLHTASPE
ncbi:hypothetical protein BJY01DRAFT_251742 [Aspergillus pseudoustus]|uniref:Uncharacterized protein n=1 Tax=Aspergillus pseudoustus TaxID=1810923 RepID=A0ABR4JA65_9EURO